MPPKKSQQIVDIITLASPTPRPRAGPRGSGMCGCRGSGYGSASQGNVIANYTYSLASRPRQGARKMKGKGVRPALDSLVLNTYGRA